MLFSSPCWSSYCSSLTEPEPLYTVKKTLSVLLAGIIIIGSATFGQQDRPPPNPGGGPGGNPNRPTRPPLPTAIRDNPNFQDFVADFETSRKNFKSKMEEFRTQLANASDEEKAAIRAATKAWLRNYRSQQRDLRRRVREIMSAHRSGSGGPVSP